MSTVPQVSERPKQPPIEWLAPSAILLVVATIAISSAGEMLVWYTIRATGIIAYLLLTASVVAGLMMTNRALPAGQPRVDLFDVHSFTALLAIVFGSVHGLALLLDTYIGFTPTQILVPFISTYEPFGVGIGILSLYLASAIYASFWTKRFIGHRAWRALHFTSFLGFLMAAGHGIFSGSDSGSTWMLGMYGLSIALVLGLIARRVRAARRGKARPVLDQSAAPAPTLDMGQWARR
jgi:predicted ferric reductase